MKIELNLTAEQVVFIATVVNSFVDDQKNHFSTFTRQEKAAYTIAVDVADKLFTKARAIGRKPKSKALIKITLKYHEAHGISYFVTKLKDAGDDAYFKAIAQNIYSQLDPKL